MANLNKVLLIGRLTRDPELRYTPSGTPLAEFGIAVNRFRKGQDGNRQEETAFVDITAWGKTGELAHQYLKKGRQVFIEGHLKFDSWTSQDGQKRSKLGVVVDNMQFIDSRQEEGGGQGRRPAPAGQDGAEPQEHRGDYSGPEDLGADAPPF